MTSMQADVWCARHTHPMLTQDSSVGASLALMSNTENLIAADVAADFAADVAAVIADAAVTVAFVQFTPSSVD